jgi:hypothetical protein
MSALDLPAPGTFIKPVPERYLYCYEVVRAAQHPDCPPGVAHLECKRWGWDANARKPIDDGHCGPSNHSYFNTYLRAIGHGAAWRFLSMSAWYDPVYWKRIKPIERLGQQEMFA